MGAHLFGGDDVLPYAVCIRWSSDPDIGGIFDVRYPNAVPWRRIGICQSPGIYSDGAAPFFYDRHSGMGGGAFLCGHALLFKRRYP